MSEYALIIVHIICTRSAAPSGTPVPSSSNLARARLRPYTTLKHMKVNPSFVKKS